MSNTANTITAPLMEGEDIVDGCVDFKGCPVRRSASGGWRSALFIIAVEVAERFAYYGISSNLITYLTGQLGQSTATAAENVNTWSGAATLLPLLGAFVADSFLGRYRTILIASLLYILGLVLLTLSAILISIANSTCKRSTNKTTACSSPPDPVVILLFFSLYLVALGQGGHKPCVQAFGADQFDEHNPKESRAKASFFNWWYFSLSASALVTILVLVYIQDNLNWALGFGIPCAVMVGALVIFLLGSCTYRFSAKRDKNTFARIGRVVVRAIKNRQNMSSTTGSEELEAYLSLDCSKEFKFLNKALIEDNMMGDLKTCTANDVEETKALLRLIPIWVTSLPYGIFFAQLSTLFTKEGATMDRTIFPGFKIPAASLQAFLGIAIILFVPIYDCIFVPTAAALTRNPSGITMLQRMGTGMVISTLAMVVAGFIEMKRLETARESGLINLPEITVPMSVWWLVPQYVLCGIADVFTIIGFQEFFYDQVPKGLRSMGLAFYLSVLGIGSFISSFLVYVIDKATSANGGESWFADNLNRAHLDYFYWLLAGISAVGFISYLYFARSYAYSGESRQNPS